MQSKDSVEISVPEQKIPPADRPFLSQLQVMGALLSYFSSYVAGW